MTRSRSSFSQDLLNWYDHHKRTLPWRHNNLEAIDPYRVWVSEVMLQQTTVATAGPYFELFMGKWKTIHELAAASLDDVLHAWQGLGYYSRARNLHACAQHVLAHYNGNFPRTKKELLTLPGVGPYTAAAIQAIAFNEHAVVVDGNVERIISRLYRLHPEPKAPKSRIIQEIYEKAGRLTPFHRSGEYAQAMMDLGSLICTPRSPSCDICPVNVHCSSYGRNPEHFPIKEQKKNKSVRRTTFYWMTNEADHVLIVKRPPRSLLGGMMAIPSSEWVPEAPPFSAPRGRSPIQHTFSHFHLWADVDILENASVVPSHLEPFVESLWVPVDSLEAYAFPSLMKKVIRYVQHASRS